MNLTPSRHGERSATDPKLLHEILEAGSLIHVGTSLDQKPFVFPTLYVHTRDHVYIHGSVGSRWLSRMVKENAPACLTVTHLDGWVLAKSMFSHSANYRSAMIFAAPEKVSDPERKRDILVRMTDKIIPGRAEDARPPTQEELKQTMVVGFSLAQASTKVRTGPPVESNDIDKSLPHWTGVLPIESRFGDPEPAVPKSTLPEYIEFMIY